MDTTNTSEKAYPFAYAKGYYEGLFTGLVYHYKIPGVEIKDKDLFEKFIKSEHQRASAAIENYRKEATWII